jgi:porphobilinogen synthase
MEEKFMQTDINLNSLIYPYFVRDGKNKKETIKDFPGVFRFSLDRLLKDIGEIKKLGLNKILLFGIPDKKDISGSEAFREGNTVALAVKNIKEEFPNLIVMTDVCLCAYTNHGHCGIIRKSPQSTVHSPQKNYGLSTVDYGLIDNRATLETLAAIALAHADSGADYVAPSAMAKKQVSAIRKALDTNGFKKTKILGYSAKFASNFYGPFRNACDSAPSFADRGSYQLNYVDRDKALVEISEDIKEGADIVMVKPALGYLDIIKEAKQRFKFSLAAYNVSGEYAMIKAYCNSIAYGTKRIEVEKNLVLEILAAIKRAGADLIITYHAKDVARWRK